MHTLLDLRGNIPAFIHISYGKMVDVKILDVLPIEASAFYVMDRGYVDFSRLYKIHQADAFFVIRAKINMNIRRIYSKKTDRSPGIISDQVVAVNYVYSSNWCRRPQMEINTNQLKAAISSLLGRLYNRNLDEQPR